MTTLIIDTETTRNEPPEVIELAWKVVGSMEDGIRRFRPTQPMAWGALATHHILAEELGDCPPSAEARLPEGTDYIIGHNIDYDWAALGKPAGIKRICILAMSRHLFPKVDSHKLGAMAYFLSENARQCRMLLQDAHSADVNVRICEIVLKGLLPHAPDSAQTDMEGLWQFSERARIPSVMPFGKWKGSLISDLPRDYVNWMLRQPEMDEYVIKAVREAFPHARSR